MKTFTTFMPPKSSELMKKYLLSFFIFFFPLLGAVSQNLVPNPSFEEYDTCPNAEGQVHYAEGWINMGNGTPEYFNSCCSSIYLVSVPQNEFGYQQAAQGNAYCGIYTYCRNWLYNHSNYREYIGTQLNNVLNVGQKYYLSLKVSLADDANCATIIISVFYFLQYHIIMIIMILYQ